YSRARRDKCDPCSVRRRIPTLAILALTARSDPSMKAIPKQADHLVKCFAVCGNGMPARQEVVEFAVQVRETNRRRNHRDTQLLESCRSPWHAARFNNER